MLLGATHYSTPVDIWSVGCIFGKEIILVRENERNGTPTSFLSRVYAAELATTEALFTGDSELQQLLHIFKWVSSTSK